MNRKLKGFLQLIRLPNLFTIPGDIVCGFLLATFYPAHILQSNFSHEVTLGLLILLSLLIYCFGLIQNDLIGYEEDKAAGRSSRPLVSGAISLKEARVLCFVAATFTLLLAWLIAIPTLAVAIVLILLVTTYNNSAHKRPQLSAPIMGFCRGFNVVLGASAFGLPIFQPEPFNFPLWLCILFSTLYITAVTLVAAHESERGPSPTIKFLPVFAIILLIISVPHPLFMTLGIWVYFLVSSLSVKSKPQQVGIIVGELIGVLILFQLIWLVALTNEFNYTIPIVFLYFCNRFLSKQFYSS